MTEERAIKEIYSWNASDPIQTIQEAFDSDPNFRKLVQKSSEPELVVQENPEMLVRDFLEYLSEAMESSKPGSVVKVTEPN